MCLASIQLVVYSNQVLNEDIIKILDKDGDYVKVVLFKNINYMILWDSPNIPNDQIDIGHAFYSSLTCMVSEWTINMIQELVQNFPLFYQRDFIDTDYAKEYANNFYTLVGKVNSINAIVEKFVIILHNILEKINGTYSNDLSILKTFLSLHIKLSSMALEEEKALPEFIESDRMLIQELLEEMNAIQGYMTMHCSSQPINEKQSKLYGYSTDKTPELTKNNVKNVIQNIITVLSIKFDSNSCCTINQTFSNKIVSATSNDDDVFSKDIVNSKVKITETSSITIKEIYNRFRQTYDIQLIYLYKKSVTIAIMKILYTFVLTVLYESTLTPDVQNLINTFNSNVLKNKNHFPADVFNGFQLLTKVINIQKENGVFDELYDFCESMNIEIKYVIPFPLADSENNIEIKTDRKLIYAKLKKSDKNEIKESLGKYVYDNKLEFSNLKKRLREDKKKPDLKYLKMFLKRIIINFKDFKCFLKNLKHLQIHYDNSFTLFNDENEKQIKIAEPNKDVCSFISEMFLSYHKTILFLNRAEDKPEQPEYWSWAWSSIQYIKVYFLTIIQKPNSDYIDLDLLNTAYNIVILLANQKISKNTIGNVRHIKKIMNVIMVELNSYGLQYCSLPKLNFLLVNNVNVISFKRIDAKEFFGDGVKYLENSNLDLNAYENTEVTKCFNYENLREMYNNFEIFQNYKNIIFVYWKGKKRSMDEIFTVVAFMFLNPQNLIALYNVCYNFSIATVYFELKLLIAANLNQYKKKHKEETLNVLHSVDFPTKFKRLISDINKLRMIPTNNEIPTGTESSTLEKVIQQEQENIEEQLKKIVVIKDCNQDVYSWNVSSYIKKPHPIHNIIEKRKDVNWYEQISNFVKKLKHCYLKFTNRKIKKTQINSKFKIHLFNSEHL